MMSVLGIGDLRGECCEPWGAVGVVERLAAHHFLDICGRVEIVGIEEDPVAGMGECAGNGGFPASADAHDDESERMRRRAHAEG